MKDENKIFNLSHKWIERERKYFIMMEGVHC